MTMPYKILHTEEQTNSAVSEMNFAGCFVPLRYTSRAKQNKREAQDAYLAYVTKPRVQIPAKVARRQANFI